MWFLLLLLAAPPVPAEADGRIEVEAESFVSQEKSDVRKWLVRSTIPGASGGAHIEVLPDTRRTHGDKLIHGENFSNKPGEMAIVSYRVRVARPGRYYVWVRAYSTGTEDNGIHVGLNGLWPETGARMQWCEGKNTWRWQSSQRTEKNHCGEPGAIWLDIPSSGEHTVSFSMREDGFRMDKFLLTLNPAEKI
jgi:hypothetical protein